MPTIRTMSSTQQTLWIKLSRSNGVYISTDPKTKRGDKLKECMFAAFFPNRDENHIQALTETQDASKRLEKEGNNRNIRNTNRPLPTTHEKKRCSNKIGE